MKLYEKMGYGENLSWCRPYLSDDGKNAISVNEGEATSIMINGTDLPQDQVNADGVKRLAIAVNSDYDIYNGCSDMHIALDAMREAGCADCPWRDDCEAMDTE